ncbi:class I SAM-dependent DNA methyltransferase [Desulfovibrio inopinatus]|uniref:class I SAM-dependent DNA methyltransferase n=1 Tax=Desulfovibrio inopinatus TaxID=102109 RepID=UPI0004015373|nr:class I SAM-dependent methyltransferase [Desulfovibrio inopinatus]
MSITKTEILNKVYTADNHGDLMDAYKLWAADYDKDTVEKFGYVAFLGAAKAMARFVDDPNLRILDAGCGTGLVGVALKERNFTNMDALDYSKEMLDEAAKTGVYKDHIQADLCKSLDMENDRYDAIVCVGTFTYGHVGPDAFDELVRVTKPGGILCFTIRDGAYEEHNYRERMLALEKNGTWELLEMRDEPYLVKENANCKLCTYRISA